MAKYLDNIGLRTLWGKIKDYVDNKAVSVDDALSATSENPVQNKVINSALGSISASIPTVDSTLSATSENPVQNKVIYAALENAGATVDSELSSTSENPVQNKVIYTTIEGINNAIGNVESTLATLNSGAGV